MEVEYCDCGAPLVFSPNGVHCVGCYEALAERSDGGSWHCEHEDCFRDISRERFQCVGCERWFCWNCTVPFGLAHRVCTGCRYVWMRLSQVPGGRLVRLSKVPDLGDRL
jgi:hypothetical protein